MAQLRQDYAKYRALETEIIVIGPEERSAFQRYWANEGLPFIGLPDPTHSVAGQYGQEVNLLKLGRMPALAIIDKQGLIRYMHYASAMHDIPNNQALFALIEALNHEHSAESISPTGA